MRRNTEKVAETRKKTMRILRQLTENRREEAREKTREIVRKGRKIIGTGKNESDVSSL